MIRFTPARTYLTASAVAFGMAAFSAWCAWRWLPAAIPAVALTVMGAGVLWLALRPVIGISDTHLHIGARKIGWSEIRRVDQTGWASPLVADLTLADQSRVRLIYPGETEVSARLLRLIQQRSHLALINGVPFRKIFGEPSRAKAREALASPSYRLVNEDDEADIERMYQRLRTAGRLDPEK